jgi:hypothetical protein
VYVTSVCSSSIPMSACKKLTFVFVRYIPVIRVRKFCCSQVSRLHISVYMPRLQMNCQLHVMQSWVQ